jgi:hypothetical protein
MLYQGFFQSPHGPQRAGTRTTANRTKSDTAPCRAAVPHWHTDVFNPVLGGTFRFQGAFSLSLSLPPPPMFLLPELEIAEVVVRVLLHDFGDCHLKVLLRDVHPALPQREHAGLSAHGLHFGTRGSLELQADLLEVDSAHQVHLARVNFKDLHTRLRELVQLSFTAHFGKVEGVGWEERRSS